MPILRTSVDIRSEAMRLDELEFFEGDGSVAQYGPMSKGDFSPWVAGWLLPRPRCACLTLNLTDMITRWVFTCPIRDKPAKGFCKHSIKR